MPFIHMTTGVTKAKFSQSFPRTNNIEIFIPAKMNPSFVKTLEKKKLS